MFKRFMAAACCAALLAVFPFASAQAEVFQGYDSKDFVAQPAVITKLDSAQSLASLESEQLPGAVWMELDSSLQVLSEAGEPLGSFAQIYADSVSGAALPIVELKDAAALTALSSFVEETPVSDLAIASEDVGLLSQVQGEISSARLYYIAQPAATDALRQVQLGIANVVGAQVVVLENAEASKEAIAYYQARFKSAWVVTDGSDIEIANAVGNGAYGVISPDAKPVYAMYDRIAAAGETAILSRAPFIAAHRGYQGIHYENTLGAVEDAADIGATHAEVDIYRTADDEVVLHHNANITYNDISVPVSSLTLAQLKTIELPEGGIDRVPTLDEVFEAMNGGSLGDLILIVEFKGTDARLVELFAQKVTQYNIASRVVVISFYSDQLLRVREQLPTISTSLLLNIADGAPGQVLSLAKSSNSGIDITKAALVNNYGEGTLESEYAGYFRTMADRGYSVWMWTYETIDTARAISNGVTGITTDDPNVGNQISSLNVSDTLSVAKLPADGDTIEIEATTYRGETRTVSARVILLEEGEGEVKAMLVAQPENGVGLLTGSVTLQEKPGGCNSAIGFAGLGGALLLVGAAAVALLRKKA